MLEMFKNWPSTTQVLKDAGLYGNIAKWSDGHAMRRGRYVDGGCNLLAMGKELNQAEWDPTHWEYLDCYKNFLKQHRVVLLSCAFGVINKPLKYTGHPDQLMILDGERALIDVKTGGMPKSTALQLASYEMAIYSMPHVPLLEGLGAEYMQLFDRPGLKRFGLQLHPDLKEGYKLHPFTDPRDKDEWTVLVQAHHIRSKYIED